MATSAAFARSRVKVERVCSAAGDARTLRLEVLDELRRVVGFDAFVWAVTDPATCVGADPLADVPCLPELPTLIRLKYLTSVNRWTELARGANPARSLSGATGGDASHSRIARTFDVPAVPKPRDLGPVVLLVGDELHITDQTPGSHDWLQVLIPAVVGRPVIPASVYNVAAQLLAIEQDVDTNVAGAQVHLADGFWVTGRAARLGNDCAQGSRLIAVSIDESSPVDRLDLFGRAHALTARERELLGYLASGSDTRDIARQMYLSEHTVQDHLKSIFGKTSAHNRRTLLSRALGTRAMEPTRPA